MTINKMFLPIIPVSYVRTTQKQKFVDPTYWKYYTYKQQIQAMVKGKFKKFEGPISIMATFYMPIPKNGKSKGKKVKEGQFHTSTKDLDNLLKGLLDSLNGIAFIDDKQVCKIHSEKVYSMNPGIAFEIWELEEGMHEGRAGGHIGQQSTVADHRGKANDMLDEM